MNNSESKTTVGVSVEAISLEPRSRSLLTAFAEVQIGELLLRVAIRQHLDGTRVVCFPTWESGDSCLDAVELAAALKAEVEQEVLALFDAREAQENDQIL